MRARVLAVLIAFLAIPALPQCNLAPVFSDPFRSSILDLAVDGNDLWAATSYGVALYDRSADPPKLVSSVAVPGTTRAVRLANGFAYAASGNSIAVVKKNGRSLQLVRTADAGAQVNDLEVTPVAIFAATSKGIAQFSLADPSNPTAIAQLTQTSANSLALASSTLYAAEGDTTVEVFSISPVVQHTGTIAAPANATAVYANNGKIYVATAVQTYVYVSGSNVGSVPYSLSAMAPITGDVVLVGSNDRTLRAIDFGSPGTPIEIFRNDLAPSGGTINRVTSMAIAGGHAYAGAGDMGIADFDISQLSAPFAVRGLAFPGVSSVISLGDNFYAGGASGVTEFGQSLVQKRSWDAGEADAVQDGAGNFLLTSSGQSATLWVLDSLKAVGTATFRAPVAGAVVVGTKGYAVLTDRTLWSVDFSQATPAPQQIVTDPIQPASIARSATAIAIADTRADGTTLVAYYTDITVAPQTMTVPGIATSGVALSGSTAAVQTFRGITLLDFGGGTTTVLPQSNDFIAHQIALSGTTALALTDSTLRVWTGQTFIAEVTLPSSPVAISLAPQSTMVDLATSTGVATVALNRLQQMPSMVPASNGNAFYKKVIASTAAIGLVDARGVDLFGSSMQYAGSIRAGGIVDVAASDRAIYTLSANLTVTEYSPFGTQLATTTISEGSDAQALSIAAVNGAVWVSIIRGCTSGACEKKTIIFDSGLSRTVSLTGGIVDVVTSGNRAYAITDLPAEIRIIDVTDAMHPSIVASRPADGTPASIAYSNGVLYVLGTGVASYSETSLAKIADLLTGATSTPDQRIRIDGSCAIVTGRDASPQLYALPQFTPATTFATPATPRGLAAVPGTFYVLTDNSLEIWSAAPLPSPPRKHPAR